MIEFKKLYEQPISINYLPKDVQEATFILRKHILEDNMSNSFLARHEFISSKKYVDSFLGNPNNRKSAIRQLNLLYPVIDHPKIYKDKKNQSWFVSDAYESSKESFEQLINICNNNNLTFFVSGASSYFPARTFRVYITQKKESNSKLEKSDFFRKDWSESQKEICEKIKHKQKEIETLKLDMFEHDSSGIKTADFNLIKDAEKEIILLKGLLKQPSDNSKTIYSVVRKSALEEGHKLTDYMIEKISQAVIEGVQDYFKDVFKEQEQQEELLIKHIKEGMKRFREWQRWSEKEINDLIYLWKVKCMKPNEIARLMQRSVQAVERMIDFIESEKYLNSRNFYKQIKTEKGLF